MLVEVKDKVVSTQIFEKKFVCDLTACKGACCIEGDAGAPITFEEIDQLEDQLEDIKPFMQQSGIEAVEANGVFYMDDENEPVTTLIDGAACAFVYFDEKGITKCAIEKAHSEGAISFNKPISCHLYPIRVKQFNDFKALTYDTWDICKPACACGESLDVPVYRFLKEPLTRAFGTEFYAALIETDKALKTRK